MDTSKEADWVKREVPKIAGSAAAFIALVIILVLIIVASCTAVFLLLREERSHNVEALSNGNRYRSETPKPRPGPRTSKKWYTRVLDRTGSVNRDEERLSDKFKSTSEWQGKGWRRGPEWDSDEEEPVSPQEKTIVRSLRKGRGEPLPIDKRTSTGSASPHMSRAYSTTSDVSSASVHFDPHGVRGLQYPELYAPSPARTIPSIHSQLHSPSTSPTSIQSNPMFSTSPIPFESMPSNDSMYIGTRPFLAHSGPSIRTFESGSKFIEGL